ncbi:MAG: hypothetical protein LCH79_07870 [Proteobacteria bacterium]|nr:hypothetical protein [Pseudomonadota bacterium]
MASKKFRKLALLAKMETVYATDSVPTGAANAMVVHDVEVTPLDGEEVERNNVQPYFGNMGAIEATSYARLRFNVEMAGSGTAGVAPKYSPLLRACATSLTVVADTSVTVLPITEALESASLYCNIDGINHIMPGVRGNCKPVLDAKGKPVFQFEFMGLFVPLTDTPLPAVTLTGWVKPVAVNKANTTCTVHGVAVAMSHYDLDFGNQVVKRDLTGVDTVEIVDRKSAGSLVFENTAIATKNWVGTAKDKTLGNLALVHGTTAGNIITFNATGTLELGKPTYSNQDGIQMINVPTRYVPTSAGNDEWSIVFT